MRKKPIGRKHCAGSTASLRCCIRKTLRARQLSSLAAVLASSYVGKCDVSGGQVSAAGYKHADPGGFFQGHVGFIDFKPDSTVHRFIAGEMIALADNF